MKRIIPCQYVIISQLMIFRQLKKRLYRCDVVYFQHQFHDAALKSTVLGSYVIYKKRNFYFLS